MTQKEFENKVLTWARSVITAKVDDLIREEPDADAKYFRSVAE